MADEPMHLTGCPNGPEPESKPIKVRTQCPYCGPIVAYITPREVTIDIPLARVMQDHEEDVNHMFLKAIRLNYREIVGP
jgi:hypothetical protein